MRVDFLAYVNPETFGINRHWRYLQGCVQKTTWVSMHLGSSIHTLTSASRSTADQINTVLSRFSDEYCSGSAQP